MTKFEAYVEQVIAVTNFHSDLTTDELKAERDAMRVRVAEDMEKSLPQSVIHRWKSEQADA